MKIRVVKAATGKPLSTKEALRRWATAHNKGVGAIVVPADGDASTWVIATPPPPSQPLPPPPFVSDPVTDPALPAPWPGQRREWTKPTPRFTATAATGLDLDSMPAALADLVRWLVTKGFTITKAHVWGPDQQSGEFRFEDRLVNIDGSDDQWTILAGTSRMSQGFHPDQWTAWADGSAELSPMPSSIDEQARFVMEGWSRALRRLGDVDEAEAKLAALGQTGFTPGAASTGD